MADSNRTATVAQGLLQNRNFILLWTAYAISALGDHLSDLAIQSSQNALNPENDITTINARMVFVFFAPFVLIGPFAGALADRLSRRAVMIGADLVRCVIFLLFAQFIAWAERFGDWAPFMPLVFVGAMAAVFSPSRSALLPTLVSRGQLVRANAMISGLGIIATMAATLIGGWLADHYPPRIAFTIDSVTYIGSAVCIFLIAKPKRTEDPLAGEWRARRPHSFRAVIDGFHYVRCHARVREMIIIAVIVWFCGALVKISIPAVVRDVYGGTFETIGTYLALLGGGFVLGAITMTILGDALRGEIGITWGLLGVGVSMALLTASVFLPFSPSVLGVLGGIGILAGGFFGLVTMACFNALLQRIVPDGFRGRVFGVKDLFAIAGLLLATGLVALPNWTRVDTVVGYIVLGVSIITLSAGFITMRVRLGRSVHSPALTWAQHANEFICKFFWRFKLIGRSTVPHEGPVIITSNHTCPADPCFISAAVQYRRISFLIAREYVNWPVVRWLVRLLECIPVNRTGSDTAATKTALRRLRDNQAIGIFIQGRIVKPGQESPPKDGVAMLALKTGAPVIPSYISGVQYEENVMRGLFRRHRARIRFGPPVDLSEFQGEKLGRDTVRAATQKIFAAVIALAPKDDETRATGHERTTSLSNSAELPT